MTASTPRPQPVRKVVIDFHIATGHLFTGTTQRFAVYGSVVRGRKRRPEPPDWLMVRLLDSNDNVVSCQFIAEKYDRPYAVFRFKPRRGETYFVSAIATNGVETRVQVPTRSGGKIPGYVLCRGSRLILPAVLAGRELERFLGGVARQTIEQQLNDEFYNVSDEELSAEERAEKRTYENWLKLDDVQLFRKNMKKGDYFNLTEEIWPNAIHMETEFVDSVRVALVPLTEGRPAVMLHPQLENHEMAATAYVIDDELALLNVNQQSMWAEEAYNLFAVPLKREMTDAEIARRLHLRLAPSDTPKRLRRFTGLILDCPGPPVWRFGDPEDPEPPTNRYESAMSVLARVLSKTNRQADTDAHADDLEDHPSDEHEPDESEDHDDAERENTAAT